MAVQHKNTSADSGAVDVEILALDTLVYRQHGYELLVYIERIKKDNGSSELHVDLADTTHWSVPEGKPLENDERISIAATIERVLKAKGISAIVEAG